MVLAPLANTPSYEPGVEGTFWQINTVIVVDTYIYSYNFIDQVCVLLLRLSTFPLALTSNLYNYSTTTATQVWLYREECKVHMTHDKPFTPSYHNNLLTQC